MFRNHFDHRCFYNPFSNFVRVSTSGVCERVDMLTSVQRRNIFSSIHNSSTLSHTPEVQFVEYCISTNSGLEFNRSIQISEFLHVYILKDLKPKLLLIQTIFLKKIFPS